MNPLLCILNPREIPEALHMIKKIKGYDKLWAKYYDGEFYAYRALRNWFLEHKEYTHMILLIDDVLATQKDFDILYSDVMSMDLPVLAATCNVTYQRLDELSPTMDVMPDLNNYPFVTRAEVAKFIEKGEYIKQVKFEGFALTFIRRDVLEQIEFSGINSTDLYFAIDCDKKNIPVYVDFRVNVFHLKWRMGIGVYEYLIKDKPAQLVLEPA